MSKDPIALAGGFNLYQYGPNATGWVDPLGLNRILTTGTIYRKGRKGKSNDMTPRPGIDDVRHRPEQAPGVSCSISLAGLEKITKSGREFEYVELDVATLRSGGLEVVQDGKTHVTVRPSTDEQLKDWAATRNTATVHPHTQTMHAATVGGGTSIGCKTE